jgi:hypothetical protein
MDSVGNLSFHQKRFRWNERKNLENIPFEIKTIEFKSIPIKSQNIFRSIIIRSKSIPPNRGFHIL